ncbi:MAG TPA: hypothetical protein VG868_03765, partial [Casimicrobiaceae bacterium]|nr:hypothetical protein [Casimicrobiaceae bacterium]
MSRGQSAASRARRAESARLGAIALGALALGALALTAFASLPHVRHAPRSAHSSLPARLTIARLQYDGGGDWYA